MVPAVVDVEAVKGHMPGAEWWAAIASVIVAANVLKAGALLTLFVGQTDGHTATCAGCRW